MASIRKEVVIGVPAHEAWDVFLDVGSVHTRLAQGFVSECRMDGAEARVITFANGLVVRELIVDVDQRARRLVYSARSERLEHHNASFEVVEDGPGRCRVIWVADLLPHAAAQLVGAMMDEGCAAMRKTLESHSKAA